MSISMILKAKRKQLNYTLLDIANKVGVSEATVQRWESGNIKNLRHERIVELAKVLNVTPAYLMGWEEIAWPSDTLQKVEYKKRVPILGRIAAGSPILAIENIEGYENVENEKIDYALRIKGDSMIGARICENDLVYVVKDSDYENGDIVIALINGDDATIKRFYRYGDEVVLRPENPSMKEQHYPASDVRLLGKVVEIKIKL